MAEPTEVPPAADSITFLSAKGRRRACATSFALLGLHALNHARPFVSLARISISIII
jgi:hypothetical protein